MTEYEPKDDDMDRACLSERIQRGAEEPAREEARAIVDRVMGEVQSEYNPHNDHLRLVLLRGKLTFVLGQAIYERQRAEARADELQRRLEAKP
jgi:hypothetical protein